ncbi:MAG: TIGR02556 family CRISPR-associated protein [Bacteroidetes bacterium]|nr:TIGR02556 family CRISPR-associated protein [Bacteroidota bacterium]
MLHAIYEIGKLKAGSTSPEFDDLVDDPGDNYKLLLNLIIRVEKPPDQWSDLTEQDFSFAGCEFEELSKDKKSKYLYKKGTGANGPDLTPISKFTDEISKTLGKKVYKSPQLIESLHKAYNLTQPERNFLKNLSGFIQTQREELDLQVTQKLEQAESRTGLLMGLKFRIQGQDFYLGELEVFAKVISAGSNASNYDKYGAVSKTLNQLCYFTGKPESEIWGFVSTYQFYTVDKPGMVTGGFQQKNAWKNYPVSAQSAYYLKKGKAWLEENQKNKSLPEKNFKFCNLSYYIIPKLIIGDNKNLEKVLYQMGELQVFKLTESNVDHNKNKEDQIIRRLGKIGGHATFDLLFYEQPKPIIFNILLHLEDVTSARFNKLYESKDITDNKLKSWYQTKPNDILRQFNFPAIRVFYPSVKTERGFIQQQFSEKIDKYFFDGDYDKSFFEILRSVILGRKINKPTLLRQLMYFIRKQFTQNKQFDLVEKALGITVFFSELDLFYMEGDLMTMTYDHPAFETFFRDKKQLADSPTLKGLFLEGALAQKLLYEQYRARKATPFRTRLNGLRIDEKIAKRLLPEMINKLEEYDIYYYKVIEEAIAAYLLASDFSRYSIDELSFAFAAGMSLSKTVMSKEIEPNGKED